MSNAQEIRDFFLMLKRRKWPSGTFAVITILVAVSSAILLPTQYRSTAIILFEEPGVPEDYVKSTVQTIGGRRADLGMEMDRISRRVMTREELLQVVERIDPYPGQLELSDSEKAQRIKRNTVIEQVDPITREASDDYPAYAIRYFNSDPDIAREICAALVQLFAEKNLEDRTKLANEAYDFLELEAAKLREEVSTAEDRLASFKQEFGDALPGSQRTNREALERANARIIEANRQLRAAQDRLANVRLQRASISPTLAESTVSKTENLADLERELAEARKKYTDDHPDVKRLLSAIDKFKVELDAVSRSGIETAAPSAVFRPDNPAYIVLTNEEDAILREIGALRGQAEDIRRDINDLTSRLQNAPEAEQEYLALTRDYDLAQEKYREIRRAQASAQLAISLEASQHGQRISIINSASRPEKPYSPNRPGILLLGVFVALAGGIAVAGMLDMLDGSVRGASDLYEVTQAPPLAMIPYIANRQDALQQRVRLLVLSLLSIGIIAIIIAVSGYIH